MGEPEIRIEPKAAKKIYELIEEKYVNIYYLADFLGRNSHFIETSISTENFSKLNMTEKEKLLSALHYAVATAMFYCKKYKFEGGKTFEQNNE